MAEVFITNYPLEISSRGMSTHCPPRVMWRSLTDATSPERTMRPNVDFVGAGPLRPAVQLRRFTLHLPDGKQVAQGNFCLLPNDRQIERPKRRPPVCLRLRAMLSGRWCCLNYPSCQMILKGVLPVPAPPATATPAGKSVHWNQGRKQGAHKARQATAPRFRKGPKTGP
jgi:hypothetical protein